MTPLTITVKDSDDVTFKKKHLVYHEGKYFPPDDLVERCIKDTLALVKDGHVDSVKYRATGEC